MDVVDVDDRERLIEEISLLRGKVARLQERVEQLDQLAHLDSLINLPNRRGFMREPRCCSSTSTG
jgi:PleD family two-component response regulator